MERIHDGDRVLQVLADRALVPVEGVEGGDLHPGPERLATGREPVAVHGPGPPRHKVEQPGPDSSVLVTGQVDHPGEHLRAPLALVDVVPHMLVDAQHGHPVEPSRVAVQCVQPGVDSPPHGVPVPAKLAGQTTDRGVLAADLLHRPLDRTGREQRPRRRHSLVLLAESPTRTSGFGSDIPSLDPHQPHRPTERGHVHQPHLVAAVRVRDDSAHRPLRHVRQRLDPHHQPAPILVAGDVQDPHPRQTQRRVTRRARTTSRARRSRVRHSRGPSAIGRGKSPPILPGTSTPTPAPPPTEPPCSTHAQVGRVRYGGNRQMECVDR